MSQSVYFSIYFFLSVLYLFFFIEDKRSSLSILYLISLSFSPFSSLLRFSFQYDKDVYLTNSHINGHLIHFFPLNESRRRVHFSITITVIMIIIDILCVVAVFYLKFYLTRVIFLKNGDVVAEVVNAVQISLLAAIYSNLGTVYTIGYNL